MRRYDDDPPFFRVVYPHCTRSLQSGRRADDLDASVACLVETGRTDLVEFSHDFHSDSLLVYKK